MDRTPFRNVSVLQCQNLSHGFSYFERSWLSEKNLDLQESGKLDKREGMIGKKRHSDVDNAKAEGRTDVCNERGVASRNVASVPRLIWAACPRVVQGRCPHTVKQVNAVQCNYYLSP